ncbi:MAG: beta-N-acetylhexosaminidase [Neisseriaceae bacterium]|nr:beta-N-acetylhexosaminidase [Neisseriaceae bacterium]
MTQPHLTRGPIMADVAGFTLTPEEKQRLLNPHVGGVILFRRNFESVAQLRALTAEIRALRTPALVIAVDHEGGRVQRFIDGFTRLPAMNVLGQLWDQQGAAVAKQTATTVGWVLATELRACGIDLSFTPVLDLGWGNNQVIGNRSFHADAKVVTELALALQAGLNQGGMRSCGKHFPGHGFVEGDSHHVLPEDERSFADLMAQDMVPFQRLSGAGMAAVMPAHVVYPAVCEKPAGFSKKWLQTILRQDLGFNGVIFSDDLTMEGAVSEGNISQRAQVSFAAGCDIVLVCNRPDLVDELLLDFAEPENAQLAERWAYMAGQGQPADFIDTMSTPAFQAAQAQVSSLATAKDVAGGVKVGEMF